MEDRIHSLRRVLIGNPHENVSHSLWKVKFSRENGTGIKHGETEFEHVN
jgi:hypothetical protein